MKLTLTVAATLALSLAACGGAPAGTPAGPTAPAAEQPTPASDPQESPPVADQPTAAPPADPPGGTGGGAAATVQVGSHSLQFTTLRDCQAGATFVNIAGNSDDGLGTLVVQGDPASPIDLLIAVQRLGEFAYGYGAGIGGPPPEISVSGGTVEVTAVLHTGTADVGESETATIRVSCGAQPPTADEPAPPPDVPPGSTGSATVTVGDDTIELFASDRCRINPMLEGVQASLASADRRTSLSVTGTRALTDIILARPLDGELWTPADGQLGTTRISFLVRGNSATWSGPMRESNSGREEQVTIAITCTE